ncbi:MAG: transposase [Minisyncoccia bacterium]
MEGIYHILNRGVDQRKIFLDERDYLRFIHNLFEFNDEKPAPNNNFYFQKNFLSDFKFNQEKERRELLVEILAFCLMPNHYHLLLIPLKEGAISLFMQKLDVGYVKYFNQKYQRKGTLFEGKYKSILIKEEAHFIHLPYYIHFNPLDLKFPEWRKGELRDYQKAIRFLNKYRWSSFLDYIGEKNFPSVIRKDFLLKFFNGSQSYKKASYDWLKSLNQNKIKIFKNSTLEP